jgi:hypothetical protein
MVSAPTGYPPGGWITFPGGAFEPDPSSNIQRIPSQGVSYDRAFNQWIPADWKHISPDGRRYIAEGPNGEYQIVDVATGASRAVALPPSIGVPVIDFTNKDVYLTADGGLWLMNPDSGEMRKLDGNGFWTQFDSRAAWGVAAVDDAGTMTLWRLDFQSGALSTQLAVTYHTPLQAGDQLLELISLDSAGHPLVLIRNWHWHPWRMAILEAPNTLRDTPIPAEWMAGAVYGYRFSQGIWMWGSSSFSGLALLGPDGVVRQLTTGPEIFQIAGGCN